MNLTPEQARIVGSGASRIFVSAAAGSGKTRLLAERYLRAVLEDGVDPAHLPTVTFTRKAAGEIRQRIRRGFLAEGRNDLAWVLDDAPIGTIHSLCSRLLRSRPLDADVDPAFTVLEEDQADIVAAEAFSSAWEELVLGSSQEERVLLARHRSCFPDVRMAHSKLRQEGVEDPSLSEPAVPDVEGARTALLSLIVETCGELAGMDLGARAAQNLEKAQACGSWALEARSIWEDIELAAAFVPHLGCGAKTKEAFTRLKEALFAFRDALAGNYLLAVLRLADTLLRRYHVRYCDAKRARGVLDFADLELGARRLLEAGVRPFGADSWLMVDEFQDTNGLQCDIIDRLGVGGLLTVGDPYQSIYAFRGADVDVFRARHAALLAGPDEGTLVDSLSANFRSREPLLLALNHVFGHEALFGGGFPALAPPPVSVADAGGEREPAKTESEEPTDRARFAVPALQVVVVQPPAPPPSEHSCEDEGAVGGEVGEGGASGANPAIGATTGASTGATRAWEAEAAVVAERIAGFLEGGRRPRDVVVLLRAFTHVAEFERAIRSREIPVYVVQGRGFFAREELQDVRALLRLVVNPHDDPALVTVLRSPVVGLPDDVALMLRMDAVAAGLRFLWQVVRERRFERTAPEYRESLLRTAALLDGLRARLGAPGLAALIEDALEAFDYDLVLLRSDDGRRRFANVRKLMRLAAEYEAVEGPDLGGFLKYLDTRGLLSGDREAGASILSEEDDVVRVMTIHKAKGLEFPVVVVAGMGSAPPRGRETRSLEVSRGRVGLRLSGPSGRQEDRLVLGPYGDFLEDATRAAKEEAARLHYVAATRAEEHLMLVGSVKAGCLPAAEAPLAAVLRSLDAEEPAVGSAGPVRPTQSLDLMVEWVRVEAPTEATPQIGDHAPAHVARSVEAPAFLGWRQRALGVRQTSFSALRRYEECPRAYYLERVVGLGEDLFSAMPSSGRAVDNAGWDEASEAHGDGGGTLGRSIGTAVHHVLERIDLRERPSESEAMELLSGPIRGEPPLVGSALEHAARLAAAFWDSPYAHAADGGDVFRERPFRFSHEGVVVSGFMDLVVVGEDGRWLVVDYKTNRLDGSGPEAAFGPYELQSRLYGLAGLLAEASIVEVAFLFLESPSVPVVRTYRPEDVPALRSVLSARLAGLVAGEFPRNGAGCHTCTLASICGSLGD